MESGPAVAIRNMRSFLADADPARVTTDQAVELLKDFLELGRLAEAGKVLFAARAAESTAWVDAGHASAASWLAQQAREPMGDAISAIETSRQIDRLPDTADALRSGDLSGAQVRAVARAADRDPSAEAELLELAARQSLKKLKDRSHQVLTQTASRQGEAARHRAIHEKRYARTYIDHLGAFHLEARLTKDVGARVQSMLDAESDARFEQARKAGVRETPDRYRADALVALLTGDGIAAGADGARRRAQTETIILVDATALQRGHAVGSERCEIAGVGSVPVATVEELLPRSFVKIVVHKGVDVLNVCHVGRAITAHMDTALQVRDQTCVVPGCDVSTGLEAHHYKGDFAKTGVTSLGCLARVCSRHHDLITYGGWVLGGGPHEWWMRGPASDRGEAFDDTG